MPPRNHRTYRPVICASCKNGVGYMRSKILAGAGAFALTAAVVLASGAAAVADSAQSAPGYGYYQPPDYSYGYQSEPYGYAASPDTAWCAQRYRSFNPATGTYLGYDGRQHVCRAPVADQGSAFGYAAPPYYGYGYTQPYPYGYPAGYGRPPGVPSRDRVANPPRGNPDRTFQNATDQPF
jgi:hypothetical protein